MIKTINKVKDFHEKFGIINNASPQLIGSKGYQLRYDLAIEELQEYKNACQQGNLIEVADALGDQLYILLGTILRHGMQNIIEDVFNEIHDSNMSKLGEDGKPIYREDGKILKGKDYFRPNLQKIFSNHFEMVESKDQQLLDDFRANKIKEDEVLQYLLNGWEKVPEAAQKYVDMIKAAHINGIKVIGIDMIHTGIT